jgi:AcrR family transcriptional regulator
MARFRQEDREKTLSATRQRLLAAAVDEFAREGYAGANINRISAAAGLAKGTVYNYFASKQALMLALIEEVGTAHLAYIAQRVHQVAGPAARLEQFYAAVFAFVEENPARARFLITTLYGAALEFKQAMYRVYGPMFQLVQGEILDPGTAQGIFQVADGMRAAALIMTLYLGTSSNVDPNGKVWMDAKEVAGFALKAVRAAGVEKAG